MTEPNVARSDNKKPGPEPQPQPQPEPEPDPGPAVAEGVLSLRGDTFRVREIKDGKAQLQACRSDGAFYVGGMAKVVPVRELTSDELTRAEGAQAWWAQQRQKKAENVDAEKARLIEEAPAQAPAPRQAEPEPEPSIIAEGTPPVGSGEAAPLAGSSDALEQARKEVAASAERLRQWRESGESGESARGDVHSNNFPLQILPMVGGAQAAFHVQRVTTETLVKEVKDKIWRARTSISHTSGHACPSGPKPDQQRLFVMDGEQTVLEDDTMPIGAYGVGSGVTLRLAMQDADQAAARRAAREAVQAAAREEQMRKEAEEQAEAEAAQQWWERVWCALLSSVVSLLG